MFFALLSRYLPALVRRGDKINADTAATLLNRKGPRSDRHPPVRHGG
jgi:hypothetical protein